MKKFIFIFCSMALLLSCFTGCYWENRLAQEAERVTKSSFISWAVKECLTRLE